MPLDRDELAALVSVVNTGSFRAAAEELKRAQSSISYAIKNLEKELDIEIFGRATYRPQLTSQGELIYQKAKHLLKMQNELLDYAASIKQGLEASISLEVNILYPQDSLTKALEKFKAKFPTTQIHLSIIGSTSNLDSMIDDSSRIIIDLEQTKLTNLGMELLTSIEELPVSHPDYPAAQEGLTDTYFTNLTELKINQQCPESNTWSLMNYETIKDLLAKKLAWAYLPAKLIQDELRNNELVKIPSLDIKHTALYLYRNKSKFTGPVTEYLCGLFKL